MTTYLHHCKQCGVPVYLSVSFGNAECAVCGGERVSTVRTVNGVVGHQVLGVSAGSMGFGYRTTPASVASTQPGPDHHLDVEGDG